MQYSGNIGGNMKRKLKIVGNVVIWTFLVFAAVLTVLAFSANGNEDGFPEILGKLLIPVTSDKTVSGIERDDLLIADAIADSSAKDINAGDVIIFSLGDNPDVKEEVFINTILEISYEGNEISFNFEDGTSITATVNERSGVSGIRIIASYTGIKIKGAGPFFSFLISSTGYISVVVIPLTMFFLFELFNYIVAVLGKHSDSQNISEDEREKIKREAVEEYISGNCSDQKKLSFGEASAFSDDMSSEENIFSNGTIPLISEENIFSNESIPSREDVFLEENISLKENVSSKETNFSDNSISSSESFSSSEGPVVSENTEAKDNIPLKPSTFPEEKKSENNNLFS